MSNDEVKNADKSLQFDLKYMFKRKDINKWCHDKLYVIIIPYKENLFSGETQKRELGVTYELIVTSLEPDYNELKKINSDYTNNPKNAGKLYVKEVTKNKSLGLTVTDIDITI